jgi:hypothetical protein
MDIDKMFKLPALPAGGTKRKFPDAPTEGMLHPSLSGVKRADKE